MTDVLQTVEGQTGPEPTWSVLWLHGLGADGNDFVPVARQLVRPGWPALRFVFPHAPVRPVTINGGTPMRAWYDIAGMDFTSRGDADGVEQSISEVEALIAREAERGIPPERLILAGFSQGGAITLAAGLRRRTPLAGLIGLSTYLPAEAQMLAARAAGAEAQPVFMGHGMFDPVVPFAAGRRSADTLQGLGFGVEWKSYPAQHHDSPEEKRDIGDWLQARFSAG